MSMNPETWRCSAEDLPFVGLALEVSGLDMSAKTVDLAIASLRPTPLSPGSVEAMSPEERSRYEWEMKYYEHWTLPSPTPLQKRIFGLN